MELEGLTAHTGKGNDASRVDTFAVERGASTLHPQDSCKLHSLVGDYPPINYSPEKGSEFLEARIWPGLPTFRPWNKLMTTLKYLEPPSKKVNHSCFTDKLPNDNPEPIL